LVLSLWCGRTQAEHVDVVSEITEFYYRKGGKRLQVGVSARWDGGSMCRSKKGFYFGHFYTILNLEVRRKSVSLLVSNGPRCGWGEL
jgi:hypothetical protein